MLSAIAREGNVSQTSGQKKSGGGAFFFGHSRVYIFTRVEVGLVGQFHIMSHGLNKLLARILLYFFSIY